MEQMLRALHDDRAGFLCDVHEPLDPQQIRTTERRQDLDNGRQTLPRKWRVKPHTKCRDARAMLTRKRLLSTVSAAGAHLWVNGTQPTRQRHVVDPRALQTQAGQLSGIEGAAYRLELSGLWIHRTELGAQRRHP